MTEQTSQQTDSNSLANTDGGAEQPWYSGFTDEQIRTNPAIQKFKSAEEIAAGYVNLEKRFGVDPTRRIDLPADMADAAAMRAVWGKLGLPDTPEGYALALDDKATEGDKAMLAEFTKTAHALGVPTAQAKGMMDFWMGKVDAAKTAQAAAMTQAADQGVAALKTIWGQGYDGRVREIGAALVKYGTPALQKALEPGALGAHPDLALMLGKMLDAMAEPGAAGGGSGDAGGEGRELTPDQAKGELNKLNTPGSEDHKALHDAKHPQHEAVLQKRRALINLSKGKPRKA